MKSTTKAILISLCVVTIGMLLTACHHHRRHRNNDRVVYTESTVGYPGHIDADAPKQFSKTEIKM